MRKVHDVGFLQTLDTIAEVFEVRPGASTQFNPAPPLGHFNRVVKFLTALQQTLPKVIVSASLPRVKILHPSGLILTAHGFNGKVIENAKIGDETHGWQTVTSWGLSLLGRRRCCRESKPDTNSEPRTPLASQGLRYQHLFDAQPQFQSSV